MAVLHRFYSNLTLFYIILFISEGSIIGPVKQKKFSVKLRLFSHPSVLTCVLGAQKNRLIVFWLRNKKNNFQLHTLILGPDPFFQIIDKLFDTLMVFLKEFFEKVDFDQNL